MSFLFPILIQTLTLTCCTAPSPHRTTAGLWMWSSPVERSGPDGGRYSLVLLDTEGIDAYDQASSQCRRLSSSRRS